jgi:hypothetical protein
MFQLTSEIFNVTWNKTGVKFVCVNILDLFQNLLTILLYIELSPLLNLLQNNFIYDNQLHYILVKHRFIKSRKDLESLSEADIYSDHNSLVAKICTRLKKIIKLQKRKPRWICRSYMSNNRKCVAASGN